MREAPPVPGRPTTRDLFTLATVTISPLTSPPLADATRQTPDHHTDLAPPRRPARPTSLERPGYPFWLRLNPLYHAFQRAQLSRAKHRSLAGHPRMALRLARLLPRYEYSVDEAFGVDGAPSDVVSQRREAFARLGARLRAMAPKTLDAGEALRGAVSDVDFVNAYRVPFQFRTVVERELPLGTLADETDGPRIRDLDGNWSY